MSVVVPSLNQGRFVGSAIDSLLEQTYAPVEILVMDGGSSDETLRVLSGYGDRIRWVSRSDSGQSDAIAKGIRESSGEILAWLNADDILEPHAVSEAVEELSSHPSLGLVYGQGELIDEAGNRISGFEGIEPFNLWRLVHCVDFILQPAAFFRRDAYEAAGELDIDLHWTMDWDLWIRIAAVREVRYVRRQWAKARVWPGAKTSRGRWRRVREIARLAKRHSGRRATPGVALYALDTAVRSADRLGTVGRRVVERVCTASMRRLFERCAAFPDGWLGRRGAILLPRHWQAARVGLEALWLPPVGAGEIEVRVDGQRVASVGVRNPGLMSFDLEIPSRPGSPFCEVAVRSNLARIPLPDRRCLSVRVRSVEKAPVRAPGRRAENALGQLAGASGD